MKNYVKFAAYLLATASFSLATAGSYDDFFGAIRQDDAAVVVDLLRRGFDPNTPDPQGLGGLYLALREPAPKVAQTLIDWPQTNVEMRTAKDESPLMMAALKGQTALARRLIERGADVNKPGWAPLHYAATGGHLELMELLLENNAFIDAESPNGTTPLMMAAMYGTPAAVKLLLDAGADTAMKNKLGMTALDFARQAKRPDAIELLENRTSADRERQRETPVPGEAPAPTQPQAPKPAGSW